MLGVQSLEAATYQWTNTLGGSWYQATNWSPNFVPGSADTAYITNAGTYTVFITNFNTTAYANTLTLGGPGSPTLFIDNYNSTLSMTNSFVSAGGTLILSNCWMTGALTVQSGGQLLFAGSSGAYIYSLIITNQGTVTWGSGSLTAGGTKIYNNSLWQMTGDNSTSWGGGAQPLWVNSGTLRKSAGTGTSRIDSFNFQNQTSGMVDAQTGTIMFYGGSSNYVRGVFTNSVTGGINLANGTWTDAGGSFTGLGTNYFSSGTFNLQTNPPTGLVIAGGDLYITGTNSFQQSGSITNLTLNGATLHGTNTVGTGQLTFNSGSIVDQLTISPTGQWQVNSATGNRLIYGLNVFNQGTVLCGGGLSLGTTVISNGGLWQYTGDYNVSYGGGTTPVWTNGGGYSGNPVEPEQLRPTGPL